MKLPGSETVWAQYDVSGDGPFEPGTAFISLGILEDYIVFTVPQWEKILDAIKRNHFQVRSLKREWEESIKEDLQAEAKTNEYEPGDQESRMLAAQYAGLVVTDEQLTAARAYDRKRWQ
jgi:hypothetical protein